MPLDFAKNIDTLHLLCKIFQDYSVIFSLTRNLLVEEVREIELDFFELGKLILLLFFELVTLSFFIFCEIFIIGWISVL